MAASQGSDLQGSGAPGSVKKPSCIKSPYYVIATLTPSAFGGVFSLFPAVAVASYSCWMEEHGHILLSLNLRDLVSCFGLSRSAYPSTPPAKPTRLLGSPLPPLGRGCWPATCCALRLTGERLFFALRNSYVTFLGFVHLAHGVFPGQHGLEG